MNIGVYLCEILGILNTQYHFFGEYTCTFVVHMLYDILVFDVILYVMQVWYCCVLFDVL